MEKIKQFLKNKFPILLAIKYSLVSIILGNKLEYLEMHIADNCNLKCRGCTHFANISNRDNFIDARVLELRFKRLSKLFTIEKLRLLGGEPLLHPDIINILKIARRDLEYSNIELVTNGLLLNKITDEFFETCKKCRIKITISLYPVLKNKEELEKILSSFKVNYEFSPMTFSFVANLNPNGNSDKNKTFQNCIHSCCKILKDDNIYICPICAYIDKYNKHFNKNIPKGEGINIFTNSTKQIFHYLKKPEETCKYCTNQYNYIDWNCSNNPDEKDWNGNI